MSLLPNATFFIYSTLPEAEREFVWELRVYKTGVFWE